MPANPDAGTVMADLPLECPKCHGRMHVGYILERGHGDRRAAAAWIEGAPEKSFWQGLKTTGRQVFETRTWRCERCGLLESYARAEFVE